MRKQRPTKYAGVRLLIALLPALSVILPIAGFAGEEPDNSWKLWQRTGYYISFSGGPTLASEDMSIPGSAPGAAQIFPQTSLSLNSGYAGIGAIGMYQGSARAELEFSYRHNDIGSASGTTFTTGSGDIGAYSIMLNAYGDLALTKRISAYLGGGLGLAVLDMNAHVTQAGVGSYGIDSSSTAFALQGMIGIDFRITRRLHLTGGYRAWTALGVDAAFVSTGAGTIVHVNSNDHFDLPIMHGPEVGLRFDF